MCKKITRILSLFAREDNILETLKYLSINILQAFHSPL